MNVRKIGHCCLVVEEGGVKFLTDPGWFSIEQDNETGIDAVIITHEHADHLHVDSLKRVLQNNPQAAVIANKGVGAILAKDGIAHTVVDGTDKTEVKGIVIEAFDARHEEIFEDIGQVQNTGYFIGRMFLPGDAYGKPGKPIDVLALPVAGPWCKIPDAIRYALTVKPRIAFPVHDGLLQPDKIGASHVVPEKVLTQNGIKFVALKTGESAEF